MIGFVHKLNPLIENTNIIYCKDMLKASSHSTDFDFDFLYKNNLIDDAFNWSDSLDEQVTAFI